MIRKKGSHPPLRSILFVCTANVTRSPVAARMFQKLAQSSGEDWKVGSAGLRAGKGYPANPIVSYLMFQRQLSLAEHQSQPVEKKLFRQYYWIITMEESQREEILKIDPSLSERVFVLRQFGRDSLLPYSDMPDPTGRNPEDYEELFTLLDEEIPRLWGLLRLKVANMEFQSTE